VYFFQIDGIIKSYKVVTKTPSNNQQLGTLLQENNGFINGL
jgi:hypothetical protein